MDDDNRYVPESDYNRLKAYAVAENDLMISVVGTLGNVAVCTTGDTSAIFSCKSTVFKSQTIDPYYLLAFLNCHYGALCLLRRQRGAVQTGLNIEDLRTIPVPRFENTVEAAIAESIRKAHKALVEAKSAYKSAYTQAQQLLEAELGLDKLTFARPVGYTARFSEVEISRRFDPEHFHPAFHDFIANIPSHKKLVPLSTQLSFCRRGKQPVYTKHGLPVINSKQVQPNKVILDGKRWRHENNTLAEAATPRQSAPLRRAGKEAG